MSPSARRDNLRNAPAVCRRKKGLCRLHCTHLQPDGAQVHAVTHRYREFGAKKNGRGLESPLLGSWNLVVTASGCGRLKGVTLEAAPMAAPLDTYPPAQTHTDTHRHRQQHTLT